VYVHLRPIAWLVACALAPAAALAAASVAAAHPPGRTVIVQCGGTGRARPRQIVLACADANWGVARLRWRGWGADRAVARGLAFANTCTPDCASGTFVHYRVRLVARRIVRAASGSRYTLLRMRASRRPPAHMPRVATFRVTRFGPVLVSER
jgi:hypothetical protein